MNPAGRGVRLDGGLATTLQAHGLPPGTPMSDWIEARPDAVAAAHLAFARAGAQAVLAGTFRLLPGVDARWRERIPLAIGLAEAAGVAVLASFGPGASPAGTAAAAALATRASGIVLETWTDPVACAATVREVRRVCAGTLVASLCPRDDGRCWDGSDPAGAVAALRDAGADVVGFNCGTGPASVLAAVAATGAEWAKPNRGDLDDEALVAALRALDARCRWVGGCCGVGPDVLARVR